jgi:hypothetical protein
MYWRHRLLMETSVPVHRGLTESAPGRLARILVARRPM